MMRGPLASAVQGLPRVASTCWWLVDRNEWFQLEMFQFERPLARLMARRLQAVRHRLHADRRLGGRLRPDPGAAGAPGLIAAQRPVGPAGARRACVRNPDGVYVEIMEDDPLSGAGLAPSRSACPVAVRSVTLSVPDLARSEAFFSDGLGLERSDAALRAPEHESLWGLAGARTRSRVFTRRQRASWRSCSISIRSGGRARPATGSQIKASSTSPSAPGAGVTTPSSIAAHAPPGRCRTAGRFTCLARASSTSTTRSSSRSSCCGLSPASDQRWGFTPRPAGKRPRADTHAVERTVRIAAPVETTWDVVADHENMSEVDRCRLRQPDSRRRAGSGWPRIRAAVEAAGREHHRTGRGVRATDHVPVPRDQGISVHLPPGRDPAATGRGDQTELTWTIRFRPRLPEPAACWRPCSPGCSGACCAQASSRTSKRSLRATCLAHQIDRAQRKPMLPDELSGVL